ncbi:MAG: response regulator transcription factor [Thauera propionica]|jgi:DNA-binding NarL/FixJ family response regulator|uniref:HTH luxR-type domain-containing protein n=1 Tax=Thauera propionica TaxID=2019431 RepID=A0A235EYB6_9RHOO|nr:MULTISPECIES: response regulator transcription factor [Thauera]MDD3675637.1 response regulator transcription factor [Thauera propionica]MDY0047965.1 response regulator transcription factor [Thauera propionica]OYD53425.1 hypothetical protein CGK74_12100 [Thauera propionica]
MNNYLIAGAPGELTARWQGAFPEGRTLAVSDLSAALPSGSVLWLPASGPDWRATLTALRQRAPQAAVVVMSAVPEVGEARDALAAGARAYCHIAASPGLLREVGLVVAHGGLWLGEALMSRLLGTLASALPPRPAASELDSLSARELEVARAVADGLSNKEVAERLGIAERTVKAHLGMVFSKLGVRDRLQLMLRLGHGADADLAG